MDIFQSFAYVHSYLQIKAFAWKQDCVMASKLQMPRS